MPEGNWAEREVGQERDNQEHTTVIHFEVFYLKKHSGKSGVVGFTAWILWLLGFVVGSFWLLSWAFSQHPE